jgi:hypothetical protein
MMTPAVFLKAEARLQHYWNHQNWNYQTKNRLAFYRSVACLVTQAILLLDTLGWAGAGYAARANMTDDQVNRIVEHLCQQLHVAIQLKGAPSEVHPPNLRDLTFDPSRVRTVLLTGLHWAGVTVADNALTETEPPWS